MHSPAAPAVEEAPDYVPSGAADSAQAAIARLARSLPHQPRILRKADGSQPQAATEPLPISAAPAGVARKIFLKRKKKDKRSAKEREKECRKLGQHGKNVRTKGGDPPEVAAAKAQEKIRALKVRIASLEAKINAPELVAAERLAHARGVPQDQIDKISRKGHASLGKMRAKLAGIKGQLIGIEKEEQVAAAEKPDLRNLKIICEKCDQEITEIDLVKGNVAIEVKASASLVDVEKILIKQDAVEKLWGGEVQIAVGKSEDALKTVTEKFASKGLKTPKVKQH
jgi:hypothetical protein